MTTAPQNAIEINNVHKSYGNLRVLRGIDLVVAHGEAFGLLGPNGAGKSTLTHILLGLLMPDTGSVSVLGAREVERVSRRIGYLPERPRYHTPFTAREYLLALGRLSDLGGFALHSRVDAVLDLVGIQDVADRRIGTYSKGMLQRLGVAQAILHEPDVLVVDEPASGLDPGGQRDMAELLQRVRAEGHSIFLCTHQLAEVDRLCDRIGVLSGGRLDHVATIQELYAQGHSATIRVADLPAEIALELEQISPAVRCTRTEVVLFPVTDLLQASVLRVLLDADVSIIALVPEANALEQFYLRATSRPSDYPQEAAASDSVGEPMIEAVMDGEKR